MSCPKIIDCDASITEVVQLAMQSTPNARLRKLMTCLVDHLHAFVRETDLTDEELEFGLRFLNRIGQATNDKHNEAILASDVLGISTLVTYRNSVQQNTESTAALLGPFWRQNAPDCPCGANIARSGTPGEPMYVEGFVRDACGAPIIGAVVDVWQASPIGLYENQDPEQEEMNLRGKFCTDVAGRYHFKTVRPAGYPVPIHGPVGDLLRAQQRHPFRPAHIHFMVSAPGQKTLITQVFADDSEHLTSDVVFGVTKPLIGHFERHDAPSSDFPDAASPFYTLQYDFVLHEGERTFPEPPIK
jgi:protocatechuate 3,4-dioxygenase beta subunit